MISNEVNRRIDDTDVDYKYLYCMLLVGIGDALTLRRRKHIIKSLSNLRRAAQLIERR